MNVEEYYREDDFYDEEAWEREAEEYYARLDQQEHREWMEEHWNPEEEEKIDYSDW